MLSCTSLYFLMLPYLDITLSFLQTCSPVLLLTALCCLIHISHCQSKNMLLHAVLHCFLLPNAAFPTFNTAPSKIMLPFTASCCPMLPYLYIFHWPSKNMLPHAVLYCFLLPYAALPTLNTAPPRNMLPCTAFTALSCLIQISH